MNTRKVKKTDSPGIGGLTVAFYMVLIPFCVFFVPLIILAAK